MSFKNLARSFHEQAKWVRISTYVIIAYLIYAFIVGVVTPLILQSQLPSVLSEKTGRSVSIEKIRINPFLLRARVANFQIDEQSSQANFIRFEQLELDVGFWQSVFQFTPTIEHIDLVAPYVHLSRLEEEEATRFNFSDIIDKFSHSAEEPEKPEEGAGVPHIRIGLIQLSRGHVMLSDKVSGTELDYPELAFALNDLDTQTTLVELSENKTTSTAKNHYVFKLTTAENGRVDFTGQFQLNPLEINGSVDLADIALAPLWPLSNDLVEAKLTDGLLNFHIDYSLCEQASEMRVHATNGQLSLSQVSVSDSNKPRFTLGRMQISDLSLDTKNKQVNINDIQINKPWLDGEFSPNGLDLVSLLTPKTAHASAQNPATTSTTAGETVRSQQAVSTHNKVTAGGSAAHTAEEEWRIILQSFALNDGEVNIHESAISHGMFWRVSSINVTTSVVDTLFNEPIDYTLGLDVAGDPNEFSAETLGNVKTNGAVDVHQQKVTGKVDVNQLNLAQIQAYLKPYVTLELQDGIADVSGTFNANADKTLLFQGQANVSALAINDGLTQDPLLKWQEMQVTGIKYSTGENSFSIDKIELQKPYAKVIINQNGQTNVSDVLVTSATANEISSAKQQTGHTDDAAPADNSQHESLTPSSSALAIRIAEINLLDGSTYFEDNSLRPRFASGIEALNGKITGLSSSAETPADVDISGKIDGYAPVALSGAINPLIEEMFLDLNFSVKGAELTSVNPYSGTYMGHFIDKGLLSLDVKYALENNQLRGDNHVVIDQLTLGRKTASDQALSLPLGLAIALLQDSDGVIDLGMEVSGDLDNPSFGFGSIILKALGNLITKAVTAPFSLLANLVGSDDELNEIDFAHGSAVLSAQMTEKLNTLAEALAQRPGLRVNIEGTVDQVPDAYELAEQTLQNRLLELSGEPRLPDDTSASTFPLTGPFANALETLFTQSTSKSLEEERQVVKAKLQNGDQEAEIEEPRLSQALSIAMYNQTRNAIDIPRRALAKLADERAKVIKTFLINNANVDANRLFLLNSRQHLTLDKSAAELTLEAN
ncbi:hypothetical protein FX988_03373 [Paraglaciecola mesophila]|uniref:DUF748 domain-containing protein n=1 Tax=Paraglaciecola mesophila TaxID=197222 RepID=A0A857JRD0_9ALTE|nr:DUF748 domain-containing protein [Paraglaciecola mesophila]QHJ13114.1 hypothetical protein FX988_03373 [Paraglaciecola mesophila]